MQQAIPYKSCSWHQQLYTTKTTTASTATLLNPPSLIIKESKNNNNMQSMVSENAVIVFARRGCCMSHVVRRLLLGLGVNPAIHEVDEEDEVGVLDGLEMIINKPNIGIDLDHHQKVQFPAVFIGGTLFGGLDRIMATHITGDLIPVLKQAKALWL
ncbi:hypothetical protein LWI28_005753 [Acer negundo]|uniref:Glutaredoxin domain-containing protein n=1 Tax=Acer negundo TaxID=4023 RepID=A0AAD5IT50_ACENE|nr:hypothetical protein LWI28_005753 [Acer negundo]KAK4845557.1 hypothetical protein QYF36_006475 [Acer negundo]